MNETPAPSLWSKFVWFGVTAALGTVLDLSSKTWAESTLLPLPNRSMMILEPWLEFRLAYNYGTAFSLVPNLGDMRWVFGVFSLIVVAVLIGWAILAPKFDRLELFSLGIIAAGAIGNGVDRLGSDGVIDFVKINYPWGGSYPTWNVADAWVVIGAAILILMSFRRSDDDTKTATIDEPQEADPIGDLEMS